KVMRVVGRWSTGIGVTLLEHNSNCNSSVRCSRDKLQALRRMTASARRNARQEFRVEQTGLPPQKKSRPALDWADSGRNTLWTRQSRTESYRPKLRIPATCRLSGMNRGKDTIMLARVPGFLIAQGILRWVARRGIAVLRRLGLMHSRWDRVDAIAPDDMT